MMSLRHGHPELVPGQEQQDRHGQPRPRMRARDRASSGIRRNSSRRGGSRSRTRRSASATSFASSCRPVSFRGVSNSVEQVPLVLVQRARGPGRPRPAPVCGMPFLGSTISEEAPPPEVEEHGVEQRSPPAAEAGDLVGVELELQRERLEAEGRVEPPDPQGDGRDHDRRDGPEDTRNCGPGMSAMGLWSIQGMTVLREQETVRAPRAPRRISRSRAAYRARPVSGNPAARRAARGRRASARRPCGSRRPGGNRRADRPPARPRRDRASGRPGSRGAGTGPP